MNAAEAGRLSYRLLVGCGLLLLLHQTSQLYDFVEAWRLGVPAGKLQAAAVWSDRGPFLLVGMIMLGVGWGRLGNWTAVRLVGLLGLAGALVGGASVVAVFTASGSILDTTNLADRSAFIRRSVSGMTLLGLASAVQILVGLTLARSARSKIVQGQSEGPWT